MKLFLIYSFFHIVFFKLFAISEQFNITVYCDERQRTLLVASCYVPLFDSEDEYNAFFQNVGKRLSLYVASQPRR